MEGPVLPVPMPMSSMWIRVTMLDMEVEDTNRTISLEASFFYNTLLY